MAVDNNPAYLEFRLSGGASNTVPDDSLGGVKSSHRICSKSVSSAQNITGVTTVDAPGSTNGAGTLAYDYSEKTLTWTPYGASAGDPVTLTEDGRYAIPGSVGYLFVTVDYSELPGSDQTDSITVSQLPNELYDNINKSESYNGDTEYRCFYIHNGHATDPFVGVKVYISTNAVGADDLSIALDLAGTGDGSSTGVADTVADESTAPSPELTFTQPSSIGEALSIGQLDAGESCAVWVKRVVPPATLNSTHNDLSVLTVNAGY